MPVKPEPYDEGDEVELDLVFVDRNDDPKDPTTVELELQCPDGTILAWATVDLEKLDVGVYRRVYVVANGTGRYFARGAGTGALPIVQKRSFQVRK